MVTSSNSVVMRLANQIQTLINNKADKTNASQSTAGLMSATDKTKLDNIQEIELITDIDDVTNDGIYFLKEEVD